MMPIPESVMSKLKAFLAAGKTGSIELNVSEGKILGFKFTEHGRVREEPRRLDITAKHSA